MRTPFIAANWKMYKTVHEAVVFVKEFRSIVKDITTSRSSSRRRSRRCTRSPRRRGTRTSASPARTCTGSRRARSPARVSAAMLKEAGAEYVIIGHSERRRLFGETDETVNRKLRRRARREADADRLHRRDARGARGRTRRSPCSIGRSRTGLDGLTGDQVGALVDRLRAGLGDRHRPQRDAGSRPARRTRTSARGCGSGSAATPADHCHVIYGGSVKPDNIRELIAAAGRRRRAGRRRQPRRPGVLRHRGAKPAERGIIGDVMLYYLLADALRARRACCCCSSCCCSRARAATWRARSAAAAARRRSARAPARRC